MYEVLSPAGVSLASAGWGAADDGAVDVSVDELDAEELSAGAESAEVAVDPHPLSSASATAPPVSRRTGEGR
ncbi:hypothetical protein [Kocuria rhizophila]|uniref:hypothetical protein n=1 Tax=Kocuria rhizophila TaxID=72000 RepID=UPI001FC90E98|nr:hypothetical protein [Kocuria rhizophila]